MSKTSCASYIRAREPALTGDNALLLTKRHNPSKRLLATAIATEAEYLPISALAPLNLSEPCNLLIRKSIPDLPASGCSLLRSKLANIAIPRVCPISRCGDRPKNVSVPLERTKRSGGCGDRLVRGLQENLVRLSRKLPSIRTLDSKRSYQHRSRCVSTNSHRLLVLTLNMRLSKNQSRQSTVQHWKSVGSKIYHDLRRLLWIWRTRQTSRTANQCALVSHRGIGLTLRAPRPAHKCLTLWRNLARPVKLSKGSIR
jgi:hypothetical protein